MSQIFLLLIGYSSGWPTYSVVQYWNSVATRGSYVHLACQSNVGIESCTWTHSNHGREISSETTNWGTENYVVSIKRSDNSPVDDMCVLYIYDLNETHAGTWGCKVYDDTCYETDKGKCRRKNGPSQQVMLEVLEKGEFGAIRAQKKFFGLVGSNVMLTVRTNEKIDKCMISKNGEDVLEIDGDARGDVCVFLNTSVSGDGKICGEISEEYYSCFLKIDPVTASMRGFWTFAVENVNDHDYNGSPIIRTAKTHVVLVTYEVNDVFMDANGYCTNNFYGIKKVIKN